MRSDIWHAISFDMVPHFKLWIGPSCSAASAANAYRARRTNAASRAERGTPRSLRLHIAYPLTFMWWRTRTIKVCCYAFSRVGRVRHQKNARNFYSLSLFSICPSCIASFSSRSVIVCMYKCVKCSPDHIRQKCRLD